MSKIDQKSSPRQLVVNDNNQTKEKILTTALITFADYGFDGAKTRDIADKAGVNQGLITYHFKNKENLWREAVGYIFQLLQDSYDEISHLLKDLDSEASARISIRHYVRFVGHHPELMRLMIQEGARDSDRLAWLTENYLGPLFERQRNMLEQAVSDRLLPNVPTVHLCYIVIGAASSIFSVSAEVEKLTGLNPLTEDAINAHADAVVDMLFRGPENKRM